MSRIDNIANFAKRKEEEKVKDEIARLNRIEEYKSKIRELKPRIDELIEVGNACKKHGVQLTGSSWGGHEGYDTHQFFSNGWSHLVGFIDGKPIKEVGKIGGGACDWNLTTDGVNINVDGRVEYVLKAFLEDFNTFETEFYKYVDKITG